MLVGGRKVFVAGGRTVLVTVGGRGVLDAATRTVGATPVGGRAVFEAPGRVVLVAPGRAGLVAGGRVVLMGVTPGGRGVPVALGTKLAPGASAAGEVGKPNSQSARRDSGPGGFSAVGLGAGASVPGKGVGPATLKWSGGLGPTSAPSSTD